MKVVWASLCGHTQDGRETGCLFFFFAFCLSIVVNDQAKKKQNTQRESRMKVERKSAKRAMENQPEIDHNRQKIADISILGGFGRSKPFRGRARMRSGRLRNAQQPPQGRSWSALGEPRAAGSRPKASPGRARDTPGPHRSATLQVRHTEHRETRSRNDFATFLRRHAKARSLKFMRPRSVS